MHGVQKSGDVGGSCTCAQVSSGLSGQVRRARHMWAPASNPFWQCVNIGGAPSLLLELVWLFAFFLSFFISFFLVLFEMRGCLKMGPPPTTPQTMSLWLPFEVTRGGFALNSDSSGAGAGVQAQRSPGLGRSPSQQERHMPGGNRAVCLTLNIPFTWKPQEIPRPFEKPLLAILVGGSITWCLHRVY